MRLLYSAASPFARKVCVLLLETTQEDIAVTPVAAHPIDGDAILNAAAPLGKIPALEREDGPTLFDSRVICRYLDNRAQAGLYPLARLWDVLTIEALADGIMDAAVLSVYEKRVRPEPMWHQPWLDAQRSKIIRALDALEQQWISHLHGPLHMGQIAVACALGYLDFRHGAMDWRNSHDNLAAWHARFADRPSMVQTIPV